MESPNYFEPAPQTAIAAEPGRRHLVLLGVATVCIALPVIAIVAFVMIGRGAEASGGEVRTATDSAVATETSPGEPTDVKNGLDGTDDIFDPPAHEVEEAPADPDEVLGTGDISEEDEVQLRFDTWVDGINRANGRTPRDSFDLFSTPVQELVGGFDAFAESVSTTKVHHARLDVIETTIDTAQAVGTFITTQDPRHSPDGQDCTQWSINYRWVLESDGVWRIDSARDLLDSPKSCDATY